MNTIFSILLLIGTAWFAFMSAHVSSEQKEGKTIRLPWEKD
jgi:hypothetical protein